MIEFITQIPGVLFLLLLGVYVFFIIWMAHVIIRWDNSLKFDYPKPQDLTNYDLAFMAGGCERLVITTLYNLSKKGCIDLKKTLAFINNNQVTLSSIEKIVYAEIQMSTAGSSVGQLVSADRIKSYVKVVTHKLKNQHLLLSETLIIRNWIIKGIIAGLIVAPGSIRLIYGSGGNKQLLFLMILLVISLIALEHLMLFTKRTTRLADKWQVGLTSNINKTTGSITGFESFDESIHVAINTWPQLTNSNEYLSFFNKLTRKYRSG